jgi:hypothetical protein
MKDGRTERTAYQEATEANSEKMEQIQEEMRSYWSGRSFLTKRQQFTLRGHAETRRWPAKKRRRQVWDARSQPQWTSEAVHEEFHTEETAVRSSRIAKKRHGGGI